MKARACCQGGGVGVDGECMGRAQTPTFTQYRKKRERLTASEEGQCTEAMTSTPRRSARPFREAMTESAITLFVSRVRWVGEGKGGGVG